MILSITAASKEVEKLDFSFYRDPGIRLKTKYGKPGKIRVIWICNLVDTLLNTILQIGYEINLNY